MVRTNDPDEPDFERADFARIMDESPLGLVVTQSGKLVFANARLLEAFGKTLADAIGMDPAASVTDPVMREQARARNLKAEGGELQPPIVYEVLRGDGTRVWVRGQTTPCVFRGRPSTLAIIQDITEEVESQRALRESEERNRRIVEGSPNALVVSRNGVILLANLAFAQFARLASAEAAIGRPLLDFATPESREVIAERLKRLERGERVPWMETDVLAVGGERHAVEIRSEPYEHERSPAVLTTMRDISDRRAIEALRQDAEERYERLVEDSPLPILTHVDGVVVFANSAFAKLMGASSKDECVGQDMFSFLLDESLATMTERLRAGPPGDSLPPVESRVRTLKGEIRDIELRSAAATRRGQPAIQTYVRDITDEKRVDREMADSVERYRQLIEQLPDGVVVHRGETVVFANRAAADMVLAPSPEALIGRSLVEFLPPDQAARALEFIKGVQSGEDVGPVEYRARRMDGSLFDLQCLSKRVVYQRAPAIQTVVRDLSFERLAAAAARESADRYRALVEGLPDGVGVEIDRRLVFANESMARILGVASAKELIGRDPFEFLAEENAEPATDRYERPKAGGPSETREYVFKRGDGTRVYVEVKGRRVTFGDRPAIQSVIHDITERKRSEKVQAAIYRIADAATRASSLADLLASVHATVGELMDARNFFIALKDPEGENFSFPYFRDEVDAPRQSAPIKDTVSGHVMTGGVPVLLSGEETDALHAQGVPSTGPAAVSWIGVPLTIRDSSFGILVVQSYREEVRYTEADRDLLSFVSRHIAEAIDRQRKDDQIEHLAFHDSLTGLPNRLLFEDRLTTALSQAERRRAPLCVLFVDLDRFKVINDSLGHPTGDEVLKVVGKRLADALRDGDSLARRGGDEFLVLLPDTPPEGAAPVAQKLIDAVRAPMRCGGHDLTISASCGIAVFPENGPDTEALLKAADIAMYRAKEAGRDAYRLFNPAMNAAAQRRLTVETKLRRSIANGQIGPQFQPILDTATGRVVGAEALLRWSPLATGTMPPKEFIPVAEQSGLIVSLGAYVLREALRHAKDWPMSLGAPMRLAINIAARQVQDPDCVRLIMEALREEDFPPDRLQLELSESTQITEDASAVERLRALKAEGVSIAIDDFGVGYSSLSRLRHLPFDTLKIDGTFIHDIAERGGGAVAGAVISLGQNLGLEVIAEGVETEAQKLQLLSRGCSLMQGFLFAKAMPSGVFAAWVTFRESTGR